MIQRIVSSIITIVVICIVAFSALELAPGDPGQLLMETSGREMSPETIDRISKMYGFGNPAHERFLSWTAAVFSGDLGVSLKTGRSVLDEFTVRIPVSLTLATGALFVACLVGLVLGITGVFFEGKWLDHMLRVFSVICLSFPVFLTGLFFLYILAFKLGWFPLYGTANGFGYILPVLALGSRMGISLSRIIRNSLLSAIHEEYFLAALGKGLTLQSAVLKHALRNSLTPSMTYLTLRFTGLLGGIVLIESVFAMPGLGSYIFEAIFSRDYPVIQGFILFFGTVVVAVNFGADMLIRFIDPRPTQERIG